MSNDDKPVQEWWRRVQGLQARGCTHLLLTVCPNNQPMQYLRTLSRTHRLYFWVMLNDFHGTRQITSRELLALGNLGTVHVFTGHAQAPRRASDLQRFIRANS
jgi:hypothetical protein